MFWKKNMLFFKKRDKNGTERKLLVVPEKFREQLKTFCHESTAAHLGAEKTKDALFKTFFWPNCYSDVEQFVKTCDYCQRVGKPRDKKKAPLKTVPVIAEIFTKLNVDACGPLPVSTSGIKYIIIVICMSSKYPDTIPTPNLCSTTVVDALLPIFSRLGFPRELQTDQGTSFMSVLTTEFLDKFGIRVVRSSVRHSQSNPVERMHRTLKRILRVLCLEAGADWEKILPNALFAYRTVIHDSTGFSPAELVHGRNFRTPMMLLYENLTEQCVEENSVVTYVFELMNRMKQCQELAIENMQKTEESEKLCLKSSLVKEEDEEILINKTQVRAFLGLAGYYRRYIPEFSVIAAPLTDLLKGRSRKSTVDWNSSCQNAFEELKTRISKNSVLYSPDFTKPFIIQCDASNLGIGVVLSQVCENKEHPIMFLSKKLSLAEQKYSTTEKECAAIIFAVQKLKCYLDGHQKFVIQTDHNPLFWLEKILGLIQDFYVGP
ncbi:retrovirus-related Pol polyprotein from transposon 297 [Trichonephila inaurata madagascariensis]|uniref:RNA-directed DNA polymerase n=1 Tax=Trichonephila inaurata madagascariensis TaxID=2747483 RepID=A0A8X6YXP1_9ARAC|nr:retrovirus-related Pol polyprotein from transposon 297 [Trichonephila inaurata madagascariensis]